MNRKLYFGINAKTYATNRDSSTRKTTSLPNNNPTNADDDNEDINRN